MSTKIMKFNLEDIANMLIELDDMKLVALKDPEYIAEVRRFNAYIVKQANIIRESDNIPFGELYNRILAIKSCLAQEGVK